MKWSSVLLWPAGVVWSPDEGVAALAGCSDRAAEEEGDWGQTAVGQQAWQTSAGQRGDRWGMTPAKINIVKVLLDQDGMFAWEQCLSNDWATRKTLILFLESETTLYLSGYSKANMFDFVCFVTFPFNVKITTNSCCAGATEAHLLCPDEKVLSYMKTVALSNKTTFNDQYLLNNTTLQPNMGIIFARKMMLLLYLMDCMEAQLQQNKKKLLSLKVRSDKKYSLEVKVLGF